METDTADRLEQLVAETGWLRRLALSLVKDQAAADDLVQDAYLVMAERPPPDDRPIRPWLARVMVNLARMRGRSGKRRAAREEKSAPPPTPARPDQIVEHLETQRLLAGHVLALGEIYRDVVLLHFFDGLSSAEIGRRLGIPDGTARWRLKHALDELRDRLAARDPDNRKAWIASLAGLAGKRDVVVAGSLVMKKLIAIAIVLVLLALVAFVSWRLVVGPDPEAPVPKPMASPATAAPNVPRWLVQAEAPARRIAGRVIFEGKPVAGATVALSPIAQPDLVLAELVTTAGGTFDFGERAPADYHVIASAPQRSPAIVDASTRSPLAPPDRLTLVLGDCAWRLVGTVTDGAHTPIPHARVRLRGITGVETDDRGAYTLCRPPVTGSVPIIVGADGYGTVATNVELAGTERRDFLLVPEGILVGRVVRDNGTAVADARVMTAAIDRSRTPLIAASAATDADGRFQLSGLSPGRIALVARAEGFSSTIVETAIEAGTSKELVIVVEAVVRVRGTIVSGGTPVPGAEVAAIPPNGATTLVTAVSQPDGSFVLDGVTRGTIRWQVRNYTVIAPLQTRIEGAPVELVLEVTREATLRGRVTRDGAPIAGAVVAWQQVDRAAETTTDADGRYELANVPAGSVSVAAVSATAGAFTDRERVAITAGSITDLDLELDKYASVRGTVVDEHGAAVPDVYVHISANADSGAAMTDAAGAFTVGALAGGLDYTVRVFPTSATINEFPAANGGSTPSLRIATAQTAIAGLVVAIQTRLDTIRGKVVDDLGAAVPDARVELSTQYARAVPSAVSAAPTAISDTTGAFELGGIAPGTVYVRVRGNDGTETAPRQVASNATDLVLTFPRTGALEGTLVGFGPGAHVIVADLGRLERELVVDGNRFRFTGLAATRYAVSAQNRSGGAMRTIDIRPGETTRVELAGRGTTRIEGTVVELGTNKPLPGIPCAAYLADEGWPTRIDRDDTATTDAGGRFSLAAPAGRVRLECTPLTPDWSRGQRELVVAANTPASTRLVLVPQPPSAQGNVGFNMLTQQMPITVAQVFPHAAKAGLAPGDQIVAIDGIALDELGNGGAFYLLSRHAKGSTLVLGVLRAGKPLTITIVVE
ncbi:MAG: sigma-70 family RNA polymerase sigma factor [Kofleriaceae bacterium]